MGRASKRLRRPSSPFRVLPADTLAHAASFVSKAAYKRIAIKRIAMATRLQAWFRMRTDTHRFACAKLYARVFGRPFVMARMYTKDLPGGTILKHVGFWGEKTRFLTTAEALSFRNEHWKQAALTFERTRTWPNVYAYWGPVFYEANGTTYHVMDRVFE